MEPTPRPANSTYDLTAQRGSFSLRTYLNIIFQVPHNSMITMKLLQMIKRDINVLDMNQIMFLSFLLRHYEGVRNPTIDALKIALPVVFEAQLKTKLDRNNVANLAEALIYCTRNEIAVSRQSKDYIIDALCGET